MGTVQEVIRAVWSEQPPRTVERDEDQLLVPPHPGPFPVKPWHDHDPLTVAHFPQEYSAQPFAPPRGVFESDRVRVERQTMDNRQPFYHRNCDVDEISYQIAGERTLTTELGVGATLIVTAATGTMGTATIKLAAQFGVARLILVGRSTERLDAVQPLAGPIPTDVVAFDALPADWGTTQGLTRALRALAPQGADAVLDFVPDGPATAQSMAALAVGSSLVHMGASRSPLLFPMVAVMVNCWRIIGTRASTRGDAQEVLNLLGGGALDVDGLITHRFPLVEAERAVAAMQSRAEPIWMAVVNP